jgi:hypothetical protein
MTRSHILTIAVVVAATACSEQGTSTFTAPKAPAENPAPRMPSLASLNGRIIVEGAAGSETVDLQTVDGELIRLAGSEAVRLVSVNGGDVIIRGTWDANPGLVVQDFEVIGMHGRPALDGTLERTDEGFALRLANGSTRAVFGLPNDVEDHVGARVWVLESDGESDAMFGVIADA